MASVARLRPPQSSTFFLPFNHQARPLVSNLVARRVHYQAQLLDLADLARGARHHQAHDRDDALPLRRAPRVPRHCGRGAGTPPSSRLYCPHHRATLITDSALPTAVVRIALLGRRVGAARGGARGRGRPQPQGLDRRAPPGSRKRRPEEAAGPVPRWRGAWGSLGARLTPPLFFSPADLCRAPVAVRDPPLEPAPLVLFGLADPVLSPPALRRRGNAAGESRLDLVWISFASSPAISPRLHLARISPKSRPHLARTPHLTSPALSPASGRSGLWQGDLPLHVVRHRVQGL